jgi:uncharacterized BrkB/YihY/UPF0761 family membrane protein
MGTPPPYPPPYPQYPQYPGYPAQPPSQNGDRAISIVILVLTGLLLVAAAFMGVLVLAFLDYCPPESCSVEGAVVSVATAVGIAVLVGIAGLVITLVRLGRRLKAWPVALGTLGTCLLVLIAGAVAFSAAVG